MYIQGEEEKRELKLENDHLRSQFTALEQYAEQCIKDVEKLTLQNRRMTDKIAQMERDHKRELDEALSFSNSEKTRMQERIDHLEKAYLGIRASTDKELEIKDLILARQNEYVRVLKKELVYAKGIIKRPMLKDKAFMFYNYVKASPLDAEKTEELN